MSNLPWWKMARQALARLTCGEPIKGETALPLVARKVRQEKILIPRKQKTPQGRDTNKRRVDGQQVVVGWVPVVGRNVVFVATKDCNSMAPYENRSSKASLRRVKACVQILIRT
jgi:hypothetical protein